MANSTSSKTKSFKLNFGTENFQADGQLGPDDDMVVIYTCILLTIIYKLCAAEGPGTYR